MKGFRWVRPAGPAAGPAGPLVLLAPWSCWPSKPVSNIGTADGGSHDSVVNSHDDFDTRSLDNVYSTVSLTGLPIILFAKNATTKSNSLKRIISLLNIN